MHRRLMLGLALATLSVCMVTFRVHLVHASGVIYIRADGSIDPPTAPVSTTDKIMYTLTAGINEGIVIERNDIILDGVGHTMNGEGSGSDVGIRLTSTRNVTVTNMDIRRFQWGIASELGSFSYDNIIVRNNIVESGDAGIALYYASNYKIRSNSISASTVLGGIWIYASSMVEIVGNNISANSGAGVIFATLSEGNLATDNNITGNGIGILFDSGPNRVFHNNIVGNTIQATKYCSTSCANVWDDGYPSGGNYWSNYGGFDIRNGQYQNETGSDGIGDAPIVLDENNRDHYPLMKPWPGLFCDVNRDGKVDMKDVGYVARRFTSIPGDPLWDSAADVSVDGRIDMKDISLVARHFGIHYL